MLYLCCPRDGYCDVISAGLSRFGDPRRRSAICIAVPRQLSPFRDSCRAKARHLVVQCKLSRPISPFRDRRGTAILATTAVAKVVQQAQYRDLRPIALGRDRRVDVLVVEEFGGRQVKESGGCFTNSDGLSDRATDHPPMLFVHSRMVRPQSDSPSLLVTQPPGRQGGRGPGVPDPPPSRLWVGQNP